MQVENMSRKKKLMMSTGLLSQVIELTDHGLSFDKTAVYLNLSSTTVSSYARAIQAARNGKTITATKGVNREVLREYCKLVAIPKPKFSDEEDNSTPIVVKEKKDDTKENKRKPDPNFITWIVKEILLEQIRTRKVIEALLSEWRGFPVDYLPSEPFDVQMKMAYDDEDRKVLEELKNQLNTTDDVSVHIISKTKGA